MAMDGPGRRASWPLAAGAGADSAAHARSAVRRAPVAMPVIEVTPSSPSEHDEPAPGPSCSANSGFLLPAHPALQGQVILSTALVEVYDRDERRLERQAQLKSMYKDFMKEYETLGDMSKVTSNEIVGNFLPFHGVLRLSSLTTKLRVVFNASARTSTGVTLNDIQYVGPTIQDDLTAILLRFRQYRFVYTADVEKMYRRIVVHPDDRHLQQIIWRKDPSEPLCTYQLNTVTYGTASAPFLAVRCLKQLSLDCSDPRLTEIIAHDFYMDDFLSGSDTEQEAASIIARVSAVLKSAGMHLRKWRSNEPRLINEHNDESRNLNLGNLDETDILEITGGWPWRHVPTKDNPADLVSRGLDAGSIATADIWWNGPKFLRNDEEDWPKNHHASKDSDDIKAEVITANVASEATLSLLSDLKLTKFSNFTKLKRVTAYVLRFINNARPGSVRYSGFLSTNELHAAMNTLVKLAQIESFYSYEDVKNKALLKAKDPLTKLNPFVDSEGLMRVGGRLRNGPFNFDKKHPAILPKGHFITVTYFNSVHIILLHAGPQAMLAYVKTTYWPIGGRTQARSTYHKCVLCTRMRGATIAPLMGNLPSPRVTPGFPFEVVGVDYAGPILAASRKGRGSQTIKVYIVIFVCFKTKCVHLELCSDLSAEGYMASLKRFVSRRGLPSDIYSDNGTQFVGAYNDLKRFLTSHAKTLSESAANDGIRFHFIPPYSPHFGGLWEAGVKSTKHHLVRVLGNCHLTFEEIYCALCQIEAILNSRPLTPLTSDPSDLLPLTPGHFLIGRPLTALPTPCLTEIPPLRLTRYQRIEQLRQHYWVRWYKECL
ncbi:uncharacterized protein LOC133526629 [Cydia pomonella]|uniref:uncharacterized protein LOC133526629 n=1 Tax=Cydia pomonella TaxID=82600 RepID=UPI002ADE1414|nr:uncharacterized protein LOC133526629 [Cydia pomonella]